MRLYVSIKGLLFVGKDLGESLYFPGNNGEVFALGLKVVDLPPEILGLNAHFFETIIKIHKRPSLETILTLASNKEPIALRYFLTHFSEYKAAYSSSTAYKFIPTLYTSFSSVAHTLQNWRILRSIRMFPRAKSIWACSINRRDFATRRVSWHQETSRTICVNK